MLQLAVFPSTTLLFLFTSSTATPAAAQLQAGTPVQAVLGWHSTSPHTPLMTCNEGFVPYCCGAFLSDPDDPGNMLCEEGPGPVASLEECETPDMVRRRIGGACVQIDDDGRIVVAYGAGMRCWVLVDDGMRSC